MKKIFLFLLICVFSFSDNTLLRGINWGDSRETIISNQGKPRKINKKTDEITYYNLKLENINLDEVTFEFKDNVLVSWSANTKVKKEEANECINILKENSNLKFLNKSFAGEDYKGISNERIINAKVATLGSGKKLLLLTFSKPE